MKTDRKWVSSLECVSDEGNQQPPKHRKSSLAGVPEAQRLAWRPTCLVGDLMSNHRLLRQTKHPNPLSYNSLL